MFSLIILLVCIQGCLVRDVFSQCYNPGYNLGSMAPTAFAAPATFGPAFNPAPFAPAAAGVYGGAGEGNVAVAGELPVAGTTGVAGQIPIMGAVSFAGNVPAAGTVSISGKCACSCSNPYGYRYDMYN